MKKSFTYCLFMMLVMQNHFVYTQDTIVNDMASKTRFSVFREPSYILFGSGIGNLEPLLFEANIAPYYMIGLNRDRKWGIELSPRIVIRMFNTKSYPISTPSFVPKATFFYHLVDRNKKNNDVFMFVSVIHHSNGQDGYFYNTDSITINTQSGSFSTNLVSGGLYISRPTPIESNTNDYKFYVAYCYKQDIGLDNTYGRLRFFFDIQSNLNMSKLFRVKRITYNNRNSTLRQSINLGWIAGSFNDSETIDIKRLLFRYTLAFKPSFLNDVTLFAQYDYGQDYYNIYYGHKLNVVRFGIASSARIFN